MISDEKRKISLERAQELKSRIDDYLKAREKIKSGIDIDDKVRQRKQEILSIMGGTEKQWNDWKWQLKNRIKSASMLGKIVNLTEEEREEIEKVEKIYSWAVSPYYCSLMEKDMEGPIRRMAIPSIEELHDECGILDPMKEELTNPAGSITRRYPDRLIINVTSECGAYCRFCQRRRNIGSRYGMILKAKIQESIDYVRENREIRDVLITGGDPLTLDDNVLEWVISSIRAISHVEIIRLGTRMPVYLPMRITDALCEMLKKYHPIYINTHFNHPVEISMESKRAVEKLVNSGVVMGNQMVLLNGVNNDKYIVKRLNHELLKIRIRPYYIFHTKSVKGTSHFKVKLDEGLEIMDYLRGYTSGLAVPYYIVNAPGGLGKVPMLPQYLGEKGEGYFTIRTWEGKIVKVEE
jgi:glutamate 2,3-aminomutase